MSYIRVPITADGAIVNLHIGVSQARRETLESEGQPIPAIVRIRAMIDTGASCTCVQPSIFVELGLTPTGQVETHTASSGDIPVELNEYDVSLWIVDPTPATSVHAFQGMPMYFPTIKVVETDTLENLGCDALIGRDVLQGCHMTYNGKGSEVLLGF